MLGSNARPFLLPFRCLVFERNDADLARVLVSNAGRRGRESLAGLE